jgi:hypothetical protein
VGLLIFHPLDFETLQEHLQRLIRLFVHAVRLTKVVQFVRYRDMLRAVDLFRLLDRQIEVLDGRLRLVEIGYI